MSPTALQHATSWSVTPAPNANGNCTLISSPHAYTTLAGGDKLIITIKNNKIITISANFESLASVNRQATGISVDNQPPIVNPLLSENIHELVFDEQKSSQLIEAFKKGAFAHIKLALPTQNRPISIRFALDHFPKALLELRMCNMFNTKE